MNPVEERLAMLQGQWAAFAHARDARLLVWTAAEEEESFLDAFLARECEAEAATTPDLFVQLARPFATARGHGVVLVSELLDQYEQLSDVDEDGPWCCPPPSSSSGDDAAYLVRALISFRRHLVEEADPALLVVVLQPEQVSSWSDYVLWLQRVVHATPSNVRFIVIDAKEAPRYGALAKSEPLRVAERACSLEVLGALNELAEAGSDATPGAEYRRLHTRCATELAAGDLKGAQQHAKLASAVAKAQGWSHLAAATSMMMAGAWVAQGEPNQALAAYAEAEALGAERSSHEQKDLTAPAYGTRIRLLARLGQGAVLLSCAAYKHAASSYEQASELARELEDRASELDAHRLASFCRAQLGEADAAWERGLRGLKVGIAMDDAARSTSTLPYLADHLLRLTERHSAYAAQRKALEERFLRLLGAKWRDQLAKVG